MLRSGLYPFWFIYKSFKKKLIISDYIERELSIYEISSPALSFSLAILICYIIKEHDLFVIIILACILMLPVNFIYSELIRYANKNIGSNKYRIRAGLSILYNFASMNIIDDKFYFVINI